MTHGIDCFAKNKIFERGVPVCTNYQHIGFFFSYNTADLTGTITITITQLRPKFCQNLTKYFSIHRAHLIGSTLSQAGSPALD